MSLLLLNVARAIAGHAASLPAPPDALGAAIRHLATGARSATPRADVQAAGNHDHGALLATALAAAAGHPAACIADALRLLREPLPWQYHYPRRDDAPDLGDRIAFAELIGPRGPLAAPACRIGFTLMAPHTFYPLHAHPAVELYLVIAGTAAWIAPPAQRLAPPGALILHLSNQPHAMRTTDEPLLALYAWSGDITAPAVYI